MFGRRKKVEQRAKSTALYRRSETHGPLEPNHLETTRTVCPTNHIAPLRRLYPDQSHRFLTAAFVTDFAPITSPPYGRLRRGLLHQSHRLLTATLPRLTVAFVADSHQSHCLLTAAFVANSSTNHIASLRPLSSRTPPPITSPPYGDFASTYGRFRRGLPHQSHRLLTAACVADSSTNHIASLRPLCLNLRPLASRTPPPITSPPYGDFPSLTPSNRSSPYSDLSCSDLFEDKDNDKQRICYLYTVYARLLMKLIFTLEYYILLHVISFKLCFI